jgi:hypothetical protein
MAILRISSAWGYTANLAFPTAPGKQNDALQDNNLSIPDEIPKMLILSPGCASRHKARKEIPAPFPPPCAQATVSSCKTPRKEAIPTPGVLPTPRFRAFRAFRGSKPSSSLASSCSWWCPPSHSLRAKNTFSNGRKFDKPQDMDIFLSI